MTDEQFHQLLGVLRDLAAEVNGLGRSLPSFNTCPIEERIGTAVDSLAQKSTPVRSDAYSSAAQHDASIDVATTVTAPLEEVPAVTLEMVREGVLNVARIRGREAAEAVLNKFNADSVTPRAGKRGLTVEMYPLFYKECLEISQGDSNE